MKVAFIRARQELFNSGRREQRALRRAGPEEREPAQPNSGAKLIFLELQRRGIVSSCESWQFWALPTRVISVPGTLPLRIFSSDEKGFSADFARHVEANGPPDIIFVSGHHFPPNMAQIFELCHGSLKIVYSKDWEPWEIERLDLYDLCLVDESWQIAKVHRRQPGVRCAVWDKLIDYESAHVPTRSDKAYDVCYVAHLRKRKNHELLFRSLARLRERSLTCVCVGADRAGRRAELERMAAELGIAVDFAGKVGKAEVNRYVNQSRIGVMCAERDGAPRVVLEYMAADVPVLVNRELMAGTRYVGRSAGLVRPPEEFHLGIAEILDNYESFSPRRHLLAHYGRDQVVARFLSILEEAGVDITKREDVLTP